MTDVFSNPVFCAAIKDLEALGVLVSRRSIPGASRYAVVGGRSNARWWFVPLRTGRLAASGLALFQPILTSARILKTMASVLSRLGFSRLWVREQIYISGEPSFRRYFSQDQELSFAYFTGTDSPHRKLAIQIMDSLGNLKGYAKVTRDHGVSLLLAHEAKFLQDLAELNLQSAYFPKLLYSGPHGASTVLVTDTRKTPFTRSNTKFAAPHWAFVEELAKTTAGPAPILVGQLAMNFRSRFERIRYRLDPAWQRRLTWGISSLETSADLPLTPSLIHGDFTPWNTFIVKDRLYVFDWEYADPVGLMSNDVIHFVLNQSWIRRKPPAVKIDVALAELRKRQGALKNDLTEALGVIYLITQVLRQIERLPECFNHVCPWDGADEAAAMLDHLRESESINPA